MENIPKQLQAYDPLAWTVANNLVNENGSPLEFHDHRFLIEPFMDNSPNQVIIKCSQIGFSTTAILKELHLAKYWGANIIHTLPTRTITKDFVKPKVDKIIALNPQINEMIGETDSINLKSIGGRFIYYRGTFEEGEAISVSAHVLVRDEFDRSKQDILEMYETLLGDAKRERPDLGFIWSFSNPSIPNFGVHDLYLKSDQKVWLVKCHVCQRYQEMTWPESVNKEKGVYICKLCHNELTDEDRRMGKWVARFPDRKLSGYHISKLFVPWITAEEVIEASEKQPDIFYNFWLGLPYSNPDVQVTRESIIKAIVLTKNPKTRVVIGVDNGIDKHYVIGNQYGIFDYGMTRDWADIENLRNQYDAVMVIDALPHPHYPNQLIKKYPGKVFMHWFQQDTKNIGIIRWGEGDERGKVVVDRTRMLDWVADEINNQKIWFNLPTHQLEPYISHWEALYRVVQENNRGQMVPNWITAGSKPDHWCFATEMYRVGMEKVNLVAGTGPVNTRSKEKFPRSFRVDTYGFGDNIKSFSPGYSLSKLKEKLSRPKKLGQNRRIFKAKS